MSDPKTIAEDYLAMWNEAAPTQRRAMLDAGWAADASYADPMMRGTGREGIAAMIEAARAQFPGHSFRLRGTPDGHGQFVRFSWCLSSEDGTVVAGGTDVVRTDEEGRIAEVIGFLDGANHG